MARPWVKWYFADWRDPRLRMCGLAARGLWADLLSYCHEGEPYGHLTIEGQVPTVENIASLVGRPIREVHACLKELEGYGVFSRSEFGAIVSRRMVRDKAKEEKDRENGKRGGNPSLIEGDNPPDKAQKLDTRNKIPSATHSVAPIENWQRVWSDGIAYLTANGHSEAEARKALMRWRQGHDELEILRALKIAGQNAVSLPIPYIENVLKQKAKANGSGSTTGQSGAFARLRAEAEAARAERDRGTELRET